jgi:sugar transferase (PEP-CTERM system associated)
MTRVLNGIFPPRTLLLVMSEALLVAMTLRTAIFLLGDETGLRLEGGNVLLRIAVASAVCLLCLHYFDLYDSSILANSREIGVRLIRVVGAVCLVLAVVYYKYPDVGLDFRSFIGGMVLVAILLAIWRRLFFALSRAAGMAEKVLLLGDGSLATSLATELERRPQLGVKLVGYVSGSPSPSRGVNGLRNLGAVEQLTEVVESRQIDRVVVTMTDRRGALPVAALLRLKARGVLIRDGAELYESVTGKVLVGSIRASSLLFTSRSQVSQGTLLLKRSLALLLSLVTLLISLPIMGLVALLIWLDSGAPVIFRQTRIGKDGKPFTLYKFRSMRNGADAGGPRPAQPNDPRCTRVGGWLRHTRLDEMPQLYNILRGDMCFVGPRPFVPEQEEECQQQIPLYAQRWCVRPGATGWAQVSRGYCQSVEDNTEKLGYDLFYIKNMSMGLDTLILFETIKILLWGRGAQ